MQKKSELKTNSFPLSLFPLESTASIQSFRKHKNPLSTDSFWLRLSLQMSMSNSIGAGGDAGREHGQFDVGGVSPFLQKNHEKHRDVVLFRYFFFLVRGFFQPPLSLPRPAHSLSLSLSLSLFLTFKKKKNREPRSRATRPRPKTRAAPARASTRTARSRRTARPPRTSSTLWATTR